VGGTISFVLIFRIQLIIPNDTPDNLSINFHSFYNLHYYNTVGLADLEEFCLCKFFFFGFGPELEGSWEELRNKLFKLAKVEDHPHPFRHTMATELLEKGTLVKHVAAILGNSPQIIYKHYTPRVPRHQKALDAAVMQVWPDAVHIPPPTIAPA
jgi:hypothetical protein